MDFNNLNLAQSLGLLTTGAGLLEGQQFGEAVRGGVGTFSALDQLEQERKRREMLAQLLAVQANATPTVAPTVAPSPMAMDAAMQTQFDRGLPGPRVDTLQMAQQATPAPAIAPVAPASVSAPMTPASTRPSLTAQQRQLIAAMPTTQGLQTAATLLGKTYSGAPVDIEYQGKRLSFNSDDPRLLQYLNLGATRLEKGEDPRAKTLFEQEGKLRKEFDGLSEDFDKGYTAFQKVARSATKQNPTGADDIALIFGFMKTVDPGSVVREGEFATAENSAGVPGRVRNLYNAALEGLRLTPEQRINFLTAAQSQVEPLVARQQVLEQTYTGISERGDLNVENVVRSRLPKAGSYYNRIPVASEEEANKLPKGTFVRIGNRIARVF